MAHIIDNKTVITGSFNWSSAAAHTNDETLLVIHSPKLATHSTREMNRMWRSAELGITARIQRKLKRQRAQCGTREIRDWSIKALVIHLRKQSRGKNIDIKKLNNYESQFIMITRDGEHKASTKTNMTHINVSHDQWPFLEQWLA